jgi:hypothetical protein
LAAIRQIGVFYVGMAGAFTEKRMEISHFHFCVLARFLESREFEYAEGAPWGKFGPPSRRRVITKSYQTAIELR